jgi:hypothetical protein
MCADATEERELNRWLALAHHENFIATVTYRPRMTRMCATATLDKDILNPYRDINDNPFNFVTNQRQNCLVLLEVPLCLAIWRSAAEPKMSDLIAAYFARFPSFNYHPSLNDDFRQIKAFNALASHCEWPQSRRKEEFEYFKQTWYNVIEIEFGESSLPHYQSLCHDLGISPAPESVNECKARLSTVFVNIVDLTQFRRERRAGRTHAQITLFNDLEELQSYSSKNQKWYPKEAAKAEMLRVLLKVMQ